MKKNTIRKLIAGFGVASLGMLMVACDDAPNNPNKIDEDDGRFGPGDGNDEFGPGR